MTKEQIFRTLYDNYLKREAYLDSVPSDLQPAVFDTEYVNLLDADKNILLEAVFGEYKQSIEWFLYEWQPGYEVGINGVNVKIYNIDQYIDWMKVNEGFV